MKTIILILLLTIASFAQQYNSVHTGERLDSAIVNSTRLAIENKISDSLANFDSRPYKVYTALLSQTGTNAPVVTVLENTLGGTIVWVRDAAGNYNGTLNGAFPYHKVYVSPSMVDFLGAFPDGYYLQAYAPNYINIQTHSGGIGTDNLLSNSSIEVRVYP